YVLVRIPRPPGSTLFPYTTLFRSGREVGLVGRKDVATRVPQRRITQHGKVLDRDPAVPGARGADGVEGRVFRRGRLHGLDELGRSEEHTSELQSRFDLVCRLLLEK